MNVSEKFDIEAEMETFANLLKGGFERHRPDGVELVKLEKGKRGYAGQWLTVSVVPERGAQAISVTLRGSQPRKRGHNKWSVRWLDVLAVRVEGSRAAPPVTYRRGKNGWNISRIVDRILLIAAWEIQDLKASDARAKNKKALAKIQKANDLKLADLRARFPCKLPHDLRATPTGVVVDGELSFCQVETFLRAMVEEDGA